MSKYIPLNSQLKEQAQQQIRRSYFLQRNADNIKRAKELFSKNETMEQSIQLLKDIGTSAKLASQLIIQWHIEEVQKGEPVNESTQ